MRSFTFNSSAGGGCCLKEVLKLEACTGCTGAEAGAFPSEITQERGEKTSHGRNAGKLGNKHFSVTRSWGFRHHPQEPLSLCGSSRSEVRCMEQGYSLTGCPESR